MARPSIPQIETLFWIARLGSFGAAAVRLGLSQPTVSLRIRELEHTLGVALFLRRGRQVVLNEHGERLVAYAEQLLSLTDAIEASFARGAAVDGVVRLGLPDSVALACLGDTMRRLAAEHRDLRLEVRVDASVNIIRLLRERHLDLGLAAESPQIVGYRNEVIVRNPMVWVANSPLGAADSVLRPADIARFHLLTSPEFSGTHQVMMSWFADAGIKGLRVTTCNCLSTIVRLAIDGIGVSVLPRSMVLRELEAGLLHKLRHEPPLMARTIQAVYAEDPVGAPRAAIAAVLRALRQTIVVSNAFGASRRERWRQDSATECPC